MQLNPNELESSSLILAPLTPRRVGLPAFPPPANPSTPRVDREENPGQSLRFGLSGGRGVSDSRTVSEGVVVTAGARLEGPDARLLS